MNRFFTLVLFFSMIIFLVWLSGEQSKGMAEVDPLTIQLETRSRAIQSGHYDYNADSSLLIKEYKQWKH